jgi:beta-galactosidase
MVGGEQRHTTGDMHQLSLFGYYRIFAENNIPVDFIHRRDMENEDLSQYKLLIVPYPLMFTENAANKLKEYIENGGCAVAEARLAWNDARGFATDVIPGMELDRVFGVHESKVEMQEIVNMKINSSQSLTSLIPKNKFIKGAYFAESFNLYDNESNEVIAVLADNSPCIVQNKFGKGKTLAIGTFLGMANHQNPDQINNRFLLNLVDWANIKRPFTSSHDGKTETPVELKLWKTFNNYILFVINHSELSQNVVTNVNVENNGIYNIRSIINNNKFKVVSKDLQLKFKCTIESRDVNVYSIHLDK